MSDHTGTPVAVTVRTWNDVDTSAPVPGDAMFAAAVTCRAPVALP